MILELLKQIQQTFSTTYTDNSITDPFETTTSKVEIISPQKTMMAKEWVVVVTDGSDDPGVEDCDVARVSLSCGM